MGWIKRRAESREQMQELHARVVAMAERLEHADSAKRQLDDRVDGIVTRLDEPPPEPPPTVSPEELDLVRARLERLAGRLDEVDQRITSISNELANQLSELSGDLEAMGGKEPPTDEVVDELRDAQTRLANEQARYQIAFRQDLADLADRLRRG